MTPQEKIIYYTRLALIEKYGEGFLELSLEDQNELILSSILTQLRS
jgi:hypothetical protein